MRTLENTIKHLALTAAMMLLGWVVKAQISPSTLPVFVNESQQNNLSFSTINSVVMDFVAPADPGSPIPAIVDNSKWLNYNITVNELDPSASVTVEITSGTIYEGIQLQLLAGSFNGTGGGDPGVPAGTITLSNIPQVLISNIGTCNTGSGINVGHQLTYTLRINDYNSIQASFSTVNVLFTITQ